MYVIESNGLLNTDHLSHIKTYFVNVSISL